MTTSCRRIATHALAHGTQAHEASLATLAVDGDFAGIPAGRGGRAGDARAGATRRPGIRARSLTATRTLSGETA
jgi:hypothetical protein